METTLNVKPDVVVVDDESQIRAAIEDLLEDQFAVHAVASGKAALALLKELSEVSVLLSDQRMPGMTGDELFARAAELSDATQVMITGYAELEAVVRAVNKGRIFGYITKPWDPKALRIMLHEAVEHHRLVRELEHERNLLHNLMDNIPDEIYFKGLDHSYIRINGAAARGQGISSPEAAIGRLASEFMTNAQRVSEIYEEDLQVVTSKRPLMVDELRFRADGTEYWVSNTKAPVLDRTGKVTSIVAIARDITERKQAQARITCLSRMHATLSAINTTIVRVTSRKELFREAGRIVVGTGEFLFFLLWLPDASRGKLELVTRAGADGLAFDDIVLDAGAAADRPTAADAFIANRCVVVNDLLAEANPSPLRQAMIRLGCRAVVSFPLQQSAEAVGVLSFGSSDAAFFDEEELKLLGELTGDIAFAMETLAKSDQLYYLARHDPLTGLANRARFVEQLGSAAALARDKGIQFAVVAVNLKRFRKVNDSLGRHVGDELLKQAGTRIAAFAGREGAARLGADVFGMLAPEAADVKEATRVADRLCKALAPAFELPGRQLHVDVRLGVALYPSDGTDAEALCANAEAALQKARGTDDTVVFYKAELNARVAEQLDLEGRLRVALEERQFVLFCQPKVSAVSGEIVGAEALIRWQDPKEGLIPPGRFIPVLEETGLIVEVGDWALEEAARIHKRLRARGLACPRIAVNVSQIQMRRARFAQEVIEAVRRGSGEKQGVDLEITESLLAESFAEAVRKLKILREAGLQIAVDDFGTGYSSLGYLAKLPVDALKIDRSFIITMTKEANAMALVSTIINLAHSFRLKVVAEGVDEEDQLKLLRLLRCDEIQGFLFHKPLPEEQFAALLQQRATAPAH